MCCRKCEGAYFLIADHFKTKQLLVICLTCHLINGQLTDLDTPLVDLIPYDIPLQ